MKLGLRSLFGFAGERKRAGDRDDDEVRAGEVHRKVRPGGVSVLISSLNASSQWDGMGMGVEVGSGRDWRRPQGKDACTVPCALFRRCSGGTSDAELSSKGSTAIHNLYLDTRRKQQDHTSDRG